MLFIENHTKGIAKGQELRKVFTRNRDTVCTIKNEINQVLKNIQKNTH